MGLIFMERKIMKFSDWMSAVFRLVSSVCLPAFLSGIAFAQSTVTLTQIDPQGLFWDAGNAGLGQEILQLYPPYGPNEPTQAFIWSPVLNGFTVCNSSRNVCLSDNGANVIMSSKADIFTITNQSAALDLTTGRYVEQPDTVEADSPVTTGTAPFAWHFALVDSAPPTPPNAFFKIMPLGDSITEGAADLGTYAQGGYRCPLYSLLTTSGLQFTFVGNSASLEPGVVTACPDVNWEGHGGYDVSAIQRWADADGSLRSAQPDIVLLFGGTNNVAQNEVGSVAAQLSALLNDIFAQDPEAWVIVSTIPPMNPSAPNAPAVEAGWAPYVPLANSAIEATLAKYPQTSLIDFYSAVAGNVNAYIGSDGVHPSVAGYSVLANLWMSAISSHVKSIGQ
jgi:lysophospholipase L1-like esterase